MAVVLVEVSALRRSQIGSHPPGSCSPAKRLRILYLEDHETFAPTVIRQFLSCHEVLVPTLMEARNVLARSPAFDAALVDYDLPHGKGTEIVKVLLDAGYGGRVIAVSAHEEGNEALLRAGAKVACRKAQFHNIDNVILHTMMATRLLS